MITRNSTIHLIRAAMLIFVGVSVVWVFAKDAVRGTAASDSDGPMTASDVAPAPAFTLYYFHGNLRCQTCRGIETLALQTAAESLAPEISAGQLAFKVVNFDEAANRHFIDDFELPGSQLVIAQTSNDFQIKFLQLQDVWYLSDDPARFQEYVTREVRSFMISGDNTND